MNIHRDHELTVRVRRCNHPAGPWLWQCTGSHCHPHTGHSATQREAVTAACQHLADAFDDHHQVEYASEGGGEFGLDSVARCRCGQEKTGRAGTSNAENDMDWTNHELSKSIPAAYRKPA